MSNDLTVIESKRLSDCEAVIERNGKAFVETGNALAAIRDARLYRRTHDTFEAYCKERWGFNASRARQLIGAAEVAENIKSVTTVTPANEAQARPLAGMEAEQQVAAWNAAMKRAADENRFVNARDVTLEVKSLNEPKAVEQPERKGETPSDALATQSSTAMRHAAAAINAMERISKNDRMRREAFAEVRNWMKHHE